MYFISFTIVHLDENAALKTAAVRRTTQLCNNSLPLFAPAANTAPKSNQKRGSYGNSKTMYASRSAMVKTRVDALVAVIEDNLQSFCGLDLGNDNDRAQQIFNASTRVLALKLTARDTDPPTAPHENHLCQPCDARPTTRNPINDSRLSELTVVQNINNFMFELERVPAVACREQFKLMMFAQALLPNTGYISRKLCLFSASRHLLAAQHYIVLSYFAVLTLLLYY